MSWGCFIYFKLGRQRPTLQATEGCMGDVHDGGKIVKINRLVL